MTADDQFDNIFFAKLAESAERYDDMVESVKRIVKEKKAISDEERNLLSVAYKNCVGTRRASWRVLSSIEQREELNGDSAQTEGGPKFGEIIKKYRTEVETELKQWCKEIISILDDTLIPSATENDSKVFLKKMKGDYYRYLAEFSTGTDRKDFAEQSLAAYKAASDVAMTELAPTNPIRLGLALNLSVFYYEILNSPDKACRLAKNAFDDAMAELDTLNDTSYKDSTLIMQLLRDNLTLWTTDMEADEKEDEGSKDDKAEGGGDKE